MHDKCQKKRTKAYIIGFRQTFILFWNNLSAKIIKLTNSMMQKAVFRSVII